jgi:hypothetical protein
MTATQQRILKALSDGMPHTQDELRQQLPDDLAGKVALRMQVSRMRKYLRPIGQDIICEFWRNQFCYRHVCLLATCPAVTHVV